jgi:NNP family nitrate/nitrite transporter-like MFS transporter
MVWVLLGALGAYVATDLNLTPAQKGLMVALPPLGGAVFRIVLGSIADRVGLKRTGLITMALTAIPLLWGALAATTFSQVLAIGVLLGIAGASFVVALPLASRWYPPEHQGLAMGIAGAGNSGTIIAALAAPRLAEHVGWHGVFGLALIPVGLAWIAFALLAKEPPHAVNAAPAGLGVMARLVRESDARWFCLLYLVTFGGFVGLANYLPIFFVDRFGLTKVTAASFAALCAAAGSLLRPLGGKLADAFDGTRVLRMVLVAVALVAAALATLPPLATTVALLFLALGSFGIGNGAVFQVIPQRYGTRMAPITGLVGAAGGLGGFLLPFGLGRLAGSTGSFAAGFVAIAVITGVASIAIGPRLATWRRAQTVPLQAAA